MARPGLLKDEPCHHTVQGEESMAEKGLAGGGKRWAAHPAAMSVDCGPAMARVRGASGAGFWAPKSDLRGALDMPDDVQQRIESIGTVRTTCCTLHAVPNGCQMKLLLQTSCGRSRQIHTHSSIWPRQCTARPQAELLHYPLELQAGVIARSMLVSHQHA